MRITKSLECSPDFLRDTIVNFLRYQKNIHSIRKYIKELSIRGMEKLKNKPFLILNFDRKGLFNRFIVFWNEKVHKIAIARTEYRNLTWSLYGHALFAKRPVLIGLGSAIKASIPISPSKVANVSLGCITLHFYFALYNSWLSQKYFPLHSSEDSSSNRNSYPFSTIIALPYVFILQVLVLIVKKLIKLCVFLKAFHHLFNNDYRNFCAFCNFGADTASTISCMLFNLLVPRR